MKTRLSIDDVLELDESQRRSLRLLWTPRPCDIAVALVCRDVENDVYEPVVFAVGEISITPHGMILGNLASEALFAITPPDFHEDEDSAAPSDQDDAIETQLPFAGGSFSKEECLPLLDIGQMLRILVQHHSSYRIRLDIAPERLMCTVDGEECGPEELCDALWEAVRMLL